MESNQQLILIFFAIGSTLMSYYLNKHVFLRFFSAFLLLMASYSMFISVLHVGFGSVNVITYTAEAGDPGQADTPYFAWGLGLFGMIQLIWTVKLALEMVQPMVESPGYGASMKDTEEYL